jgi:drug/metabolite transporter (DMT)-like permease
MSDQSNTIARPLGVLLQLLIACAFASNHTAARMAFDAGLSFSTAVVVRSAATAIFLLFLLKMAKISLRLPKAITYKGILIGLLIALQSYCV